MKRPGTKKTPLTAFAFTCLAAGVPALVTNQEIDYVPEEFPFPRYLQELTIATEDDAEPELSFASLFHNYERAVSCRWDDNQFNDLEAKKYLDKHGVKATWYLNSNDVFYLTDEGQDFRPAAHVLIEDGHSIGSHALTHPYMTYTSRNRMFEEIAGVRIEWEAECDTQINSHAFSFVDYRNDVEGDVVQADIIRTLMRSGIYHAPVFANFNDLVPSDMVLSVIMPPENQSLEEFKKAVDWAVGDAKLAKESPLISHSMHAWYDTPLNPYGFDELERRLEYLNNAGDYWQCNQNQYAAYWYQQTRTDIRPAGEKRWLLERPAVTWLNDDIPLTLVVEAETESAPSVMLEGEELAPLENSSQGRWLYDLPHTTKKGLPKLVGHVANKENKKLSEVLSSDPDFPGLEAATTWKDNALTTQIRNTTDAALEDVTITWRLPVAWNEGVAVREVKDVAAGDHVQEFMIPTLATRDPKLLAGDTIMVAQIDFVQNGGTGRLYSTVNVTNPSPAFFPSGNTQVWGPILGKIFDLEAFQKAMEGGEFPKDFKLTNGIGIGLHDFEAVCKYDRSHLDPEVVPTNCNWYDITPYVYLLRSTVHSQRGQDVRLLALEEDIDGVWFNGVPAEEGFRGHLEPGDNEIVIVHFHKRASGTPRCNGAWLRLVDEQGKRVENISWNQPQ